MHMLKRLKRHLNRWNKWRKRSLNGPIYKFFVLIGIKKSPTFAFVLSDDEEDEYARRYDMIQAVNACNLGCESFIVALRGMAEAMAAGESSVDDLKDNLTDHNSMVK